MKMQILLVKLLKKLEALLQSKKGDVTLTLEEWNAIGLSQG